MTTVESTRRLILHYGALTALRTSLELHLRMAAELPILLSGPSKGEKHTLSKPRVTLGRKGADIPLNDPEISRHHCLLEVTGHAHQSEGPGFDQRYILRRRTRTRGHAAGWY